MIKVNKHYSYVDLMVGKLNPDLVERTRAYLNEKGDCILGEGQGDLSLSKLVIPGKSDYSYHYDVYHLIDINSVAVLKQYWQQKNPENFPTLTCIVYGINKVLNDLFLENLILNVIDSNDEKKKILDKLKKS